MSDAHQIVKLLRLIRHDWINEIQLIKANLDLNRVDRASEILDMIISKAKNEAELSNLGSPKFASLLLTYNLERPAVVLDFEVIGNQAESPNLAAYDEALFHFFKECFAYLNEINGSYDEANMTLMIDHQRDDVKFTLDFVGNIVEPEQAMAYFTKLASNHSWAFDTQYIHNEEVVFAFSIRHN